MIDGRSGILGALRDSNFVDVSCGRGNSENVYILTDNGILCMFKAGRVIDKWLDLKVFVMVLIHDILVIQQYVSKRFKTHILLLFRPPMLFVHVLEVS